MVEIEDLVKEQMIKKDVLVEIESLVSEHIYDRKGVHEVMEVGIVCILLGMDTERC